MSTCNSSFILVHKITWNVAKTHLFFIFSFVLKDNYYFLKKPIFGLTRIISYSILTFGVLEKTLINICIGFVVVVRIFNATRHRRHIDAAAIAMMYLYLYSLAFMDHPCTLGAAVCHQALSTLYSTQGTSSMS